MWNNFDGHPYTQDAFKARVDLIEWTTWKPLFIMQHATGSPTLSDWTKSGTSPAQRIKNMQNLYEVQDHWQHGPHLFIAPDYIWGFSNLLERGTHCSCCNGFSIGIECVGYYSPGHDEWSTGDGAKVRDNFVFAAAVLHNKLGLHPDPFILWKTGLHQHSMCKADGHSICPGPLVDRNDVAKRIAAKMLELRGTSPEPAPLSAAPAVQITAPVGPITATMSVFDAQRSLNAAGYRPLLTVDGQLGPKTQAAIAKFQSSKSIFADGTLSAATVAALESVGGVKA